MDSSLDSISRLLSSQVLNSLGSEVIIMAIKIDGVVVAGAGGSGSPGKSAYEYAKEAGYTGTEAEFSNLLANAATTQYVDNKEVPSHNHAASDITSGTLGTARGGTGITSNPSMLVNLATTVAASVFATSPRPGVTGTLPVANGGTGVTTIDALKTALGVSSGGCNIATGSYTGADSTSKTLTFSFAPKLVIIAGYLTSTSATGTLPIGVFIKSGNSYSASHLLGSGGSDSCKVTQSWSNNSVTLSVSASGYKPHINGSSYTYNYTAIG